MAYRSGTYIAFHAGGTTDPTASDMKYYRMIQAWHANDNIEFKCVNSHEKASAVRDTSSKETLRRSLVERLKNSRNFLLIVTANTRKDTDWIPFEIAEAVDRFRLPIIAAYPGYTRIMKPAELRPLWPPVLAARIDNGSAKVIHVPFARKFVDDAISQFGVNHKSPATGLNHYTAEAHTALSA